jgi:hypothetical protein
MMVTFQATVLEVEVLNDPYNVGQLGFVVSTIEVGSSAKFDCVFLFARHELQLMQERLAMFTNKINPVYVIVVDGELIGSATIMVQKWSVNDGPIYIGRRTKLENVCMEEMINNTIARGMTEMLGACEEQYETQALEFITRAAILRTGISFEALAERARLNMIDRESY